MTDLPDRWVRTTLGAVAQVIRNGIFVSRPSNEPPGVPILRISAVSPAKVDVTDRKYVGVGEGVIERFAVQPGDLLFTRYNGSRNLVGRCGLVPPHDGPLLHPDKLIRVVVPPNIANSRFVAYQMETPAVRSYFEPRIRTTAGQSGISGADVRAVPLLLPPIEEQSRIIGLLEDQMSRLDAAGGYLASAMQHVDALREAWLSQHEVLRSAPTVLLADLLAVGLSNGRSVQTREGGFPVLRLTALKDGVIDLSEHKPGAWTEDEARPFLVSLGDLFVSRGNGSRRLVGRGGLVTDAEPAVAYPDTLIRIRVRVDRMLPEFLALVRQPHFETWSCLCWLEAAA